MFSGSVEHICGLVTVREMNTSYWNHWTLAVIHWEVEDALSHIFRTCCSGESRSFAVSK